MLSDQMQGVVMAIQLLREIHQDVTHLQLLPVVQAVDGAGVPLRTVLAVTALITVISDMRSDQIQDAENPTQPVMENPLGVTLTQIPFAAHLTAGVGVLLRTANVMAA